MSYADIALEKRNKAVADMRAILDNASEDGLTPEELEQVERAEADADKYTKEVERANRAADFAAEAIELRGVPEVQTATVDEPFDENRELARIWKTGGEYTAELRALAIADGHVPTTYSQQVVVYERDFTPMLNADIVTIMPTADGNPISVPKVTADPAHGGTVTAEAAGITASDLTPGTATLNAYKYAHLGQWSSEVDIDNNIGLRDIIAFTAARELAQDINTALTTGDGSGKPNGIVTAAANGGTATGTASGTSFDNFVSPADIVDLKFSLSQPYRNRGAFLVSTTMHAKLRKMRSSDGAWLYQNAPIVGQPDTFDGSPVYENAALAAVASATKSVLFGDLKRYVVRRLPLRVDASIHYAFNTDSLTLRTIERVDGDLMDAAAVKYLVSADT